MTAKQMQAEIAKLTQRACVSTDVAYLTQRLAALRRRAAKGERMPNEHRDPSAVVSVSLTRRRRDLLAKACAAKGTTASAIARDAFDRWFRENGYRVEIEHVLRMES